jgi:hypothetical protein
VFSRVYRISLGPADRDLLPFFEALDRLPPGRRSVALLAAIRGGAAAGQREIDRKESASAARTITVLLADFE